MCTNKTAGEVSLHWYVYCVVPVSVALCVCVCALPCAVEGRATGLNKSLVERIFMKREVNATWEREGGERESRRENVTVMY